MKIGLFGRGRLGSAILSVASRQEDIEVVWSVDVGEQPSGPVDVALDATLAECVPGHLDWALETGTDLVIAATGWELPDLKERVAGRIGVLTATNFSLTVALMARFAEVLGRYVQGDPSKDPFLYESHHRMKADYPSGTAKTLAQALMRGCPRKTEWVMGTAQPHQLSMAVQRTGTEFGLHTVGIDTPTETFTLTHHARNRETLAEGALTAARWIKGRKGLYAMSDLSASLLDPLFDFGAKS
jgi:4-hydroxy-tetrahydrodipicolinate reductase